MADTPEGDELLLEDKVEGDLPETEEGKQGDPESGELDEGEPEIIFGDEAAPASGERETGLVKHLREEIRKRDKLLSERPSPQPQQIEVGDKPTIEGCEWDQEKFEAEYEAWNDRKAAAERQLTEGQQQERAAQEAWQGDVRRFEAKKAELTVPGAEDAIETAMAGLNQVQQAVIVKAADNPALVFAALGKHPGKLAEIASIQDPLKQAAAVAKLEGTLTVAPRRKAPEPEQIEGGNASVKHGAADKEVERLERRVAERGGDATELLRKRREARRAQAK